MNTIAPTTCLFCNGSGCSCCQPGAVPDWFTAGSTAPASHIQNVKLGKHPLGFDLLPDNKGLKATCGNCLWRVRIRYHDQTYTKCTQVKLTKGPATDIRNKWLACILYEKKDYQP